MLLVIGLFVGAAILELFLWLLPASRLRKYGATAIIPVVVLASIGTVIVRPGVVSAMLGVMAAYRICNLLRVIISRMHEQYLRRQAFQSSAWIIGMQATTMLLWDAGIRLGGRPYHVFLGITIISLAAAMIMLYSVLRHVRTTRAPQLPHGGITDADLPTVTVAIPARNETEDLDLCLRSLIASDYPKLEIIVLDDCSQDKRTPEIIRGFAHDGVRFIPGEIPEAGWLAKNFAYQRLFEEANGELMLFCGVDVRFQPQTLRRLVTTLIIKKKSMLSAMPKNTIPSFTNEGSSSLLQTMRYAWELALPRRLFSRPPVLSTCWLVRRDLIRSAGGFGAVSRSIVPESYFARVSVVHDGYTFVRSDEHIGLSSNKSFAEQRATAVRVRYPQVHRRIELVLLLTLAELACLVSPYVLVLAGLLGHWSTLLLLLNLMSIFMLTCMYSAVTVLTYQAALSRSLITLPFAALVDVYLLNYSMIMYEFFTVTWKGRNVCIPVMRVVERAEMFDAADSHVAAVGRRSA